MKNLAFHRSPFTREASKLTVYCEAEERRLYFACIYRNRPHFLSFTVFLPVSFPYRTAIRRSVRLRALPVHYSQFTADYSLYLPVFDRFFLNSHNSSANWKRFFLRQAVGADLPFSQAAAS